MTPKNNFFSLLTPAPSFFVSSKYDFASTIFESWGDDKMMIVFRK